MVEGYRTEDEAKRDRQRQRREMSAARGATLDRALDELRSAIERLRQSDIPPNCVIETQTKPGWFREARWIRGSPAWQLRPPATDWYGDPKFTYAVDVEGRFFSGRGIGMRQEYRGHAMTEDEVRSAAVYLLADARQLLGEPHDWALYSDGM